MIRLLSVKCHSTPIKWPLPLPLTNHLPPRFTTIQWPLNFWTCRNCNLSSGTWGCHGWTHCRADRWHLNGEKFMVGWPRLMLVEVAWGLMRKILSMTKYELHVLLSRVVSGYWKKMEWRENIHACRVNTHWFVFVISFPERSLHLVLVSTHNSVKMVTWASSVNPSSLTYSYHLWWAPHRPHRQSAITNDDDYPFERLQTWKWASEASLNDQSTGVCWKCPHFFHSEAEFDVSMIYSG